MRTLPAVLLVAGLLAACEDPSSTDAGRDATPDAPADGPSDLGNDLQPGDTGVDATIPDVPADVPADLPVDVATDASMDAGTDGGILPPMHLLLTEVVVAPSGAEFIEIHNPGTVAVPLDDVYLANVAWYPRVFAAGGPPAATPGDFVARFPAGATLAPGAYQTVSIAPPALFPVYHHALCPTYHLPHADPGLGFCTGAQAMRAVPGVPGSIGADPALNNASGAVLLFRWDGAADLVRDLDYVYYGTPDPARPVVDKTGLMVDGPDPDPTATAYRFDTSERLQQQAPVHALGAASMRCNLGEGAEARAGGNGILGHDETSEDLALTWRVTPAPHEAEGGLITSIEASPNQPNPCP